MDLDQEQSEENIEIEGWNEEEEVTYDEVCLEKNKK